MDLLATVREAIDYTRKNVEYVSKYISECIEALNAIKIYLNENAPECNTVSIDDTIRIMNKAVESEGNALSGLLEQIDKSIVKIKENILSQVKVRWKALFLPYKASMWTSLESIWLEAMADPNCDAKVVVIPYNDLGIYEEREKFNYEGDKFPDYVPIIHYNDYDIAKEQPEMIFIHNPYDDFNSVTRVPEKYYSVNLKPYTKCLVYSPYFTIGRYYPGKGDFQYTMPGVYNADKIIVQSEYVKKIFEEFNHPSDKLLAVGSPKVDAIINMNKKSAEIPIEWREKISGKKIFLLNTHLYYFVRYNEKAIKNHKEILDTFLRRKDCALIWRPHPLMKTMLRNKYDNYIDFIERMEYAIENSDNCVIDTTGNYSIAFRCSDALISTYSSLVNEYMITGKPVLIFQRRPAQTDAELFPVNYLYNYYRYGAGSMTYNQFIDMVISGDDPLREERMKMLSNAFLNFDGTAGEKAYKKIVEEICIKK